MARARRGSERMVRQMSFTQRESFLWSGQTGFAAGTRREQGGRAMSRFGWAGIGVALLAVAGCGQSGTGEAGDGAGPQLRDILIVGERVFPESLDADAA